MQNTAPTVFFASRLRLDVTRPDLEAMSLTLLERPLFYVGGHFVSFLGIIAFVALFGTGLLVAHGLQPKF
jgi:hypothetical protein